ncbi:MAG: glycosyltransferase [Flavobacteriales bacterium]|nr:glycosyltransferase [Flavobacteriales bacterium]
MNVLLIAYEFPPLNSGGSHRPYRIASHLLRSGIRPIVVTPEASGHGEGNIDPSLGGDSDERMTVVRTPLDPKGPTYDLHATYYLHIVDPAARRWMHHLRPTIERIHREHRLDAILLTAPPFSLARPCARIAKDLGLPFILDLRDGWSHWIVTPYASYLHYRLTLREERLALESADAIVATSDQTITDLKSLHPHIAADRFHLITNSYAGDVPEIPERITMRTPTVAEPLRIGYVGSFYYTPYQRALMFSPWYRKKPHQFLQYAPRKEDWRYRSPHFFFKALAALRTKRPELAGLVRIELAGHVPAWLRDMVQEHGLMDLVVFHGRLGHREALALQARCDALLITSSKVIGGQDYSIAGKTFEYFQALRPILAFVSEGAQKRILQRSGLGLLCPPDDLSASVLVIERMLHGGIELRPDADFIRSMHSSVMAERFATVIRAVSGRRTKVIV